MSLQQHERDAKLARAEAKLTMAVAEIAQEHTLTTAEVCMALSTVLSRWVAYELRDERSTTGEHLNRRKAE